MICIFIDETSDNKFPDYFGLCCVAINDSFYSKIKSECHQILSEGGWDIEKEFKGSYLFSASKGCIDVDIEKRIELAEKILELATAKKNTRMKLSYFKTKTTNHKSEYLENIPYLIRNLIMKYPHGRKQSKNLVSISCDKRSDISLQELRNSIMPAINSAHCELYEDIVQVDSNCQTIGLIFSDIIGYLMSRIENILHDSELFENLTPEMKEKSGKLKKLESSWFLIDKIKKMTIYEYKEKN